MRYLIRTFRYFFSMQTWLIAIVEHPAVVTHTLRWVHCSVTGAAIVTVGLTRTVRYMASHALPAWE